MSAGQEEVVPGDSSDTTDNANLLAAFMTLGSLINVFVFTAQVPLMRLIRKEGDSSKYSPLPSHATLLMCSLWMWYSYYYQPRLAFFLNNGGGAAMAIFYLYFHARYSPTKAQRNRIIYTAVGLVLFATVLYVGAVTLTSLEQAKNLCAGVSVAINVVFFVSPLKALFTALKELDTKRVPVLLSVMTFMGSATWSTVGALINDTFILFPNALGFALTTLQLAILGYIRWKTRNGGGASAASIPDTDSAAAVVPAAANGGAAFGSAVDSGVAVKVDDSAERLSLVKAHQAMVERELGAATEDLFAKVSARLEGPPVVATSRPPRRSAAAAIAATSSFAEEVETTAAMQFVPVYSQASAAATTTTTATTAAATNAWEAKLPSCSTSSSAAGIIDYNSGEYSRITSSCCMKDEAKELKEAPITAIPVAVAEGAGSGGAASWD